MRSLACIRRHLLHPTPIPTSPLILSTAFHSIYCAPFAPRPPSSWFGSLAYNPAVAASVTAPHAAAANEPQPLHSTVALLQLPSYLIPPPAPLQPAMSSRGSALYADTCAHITAARSKPRATTSCVPVLQPPPSRSDWYSRPLLRNRVVWRIDVVGAVVGSAYAGVLWDLRPGLVLCKQHGRTPRFSKQMGTKCILLANSSSDHFVCKASSYPTGASERHQKVEVEQSSCSQVQRGQSGATYQVHPSGCGREV